MYESSKATQDEAKQDMSPGPHRRTGASMPISWLSRAEFVQFQAFEIGVEAFFVGKVEKFRLTEIKVFDPKANKL